MVVKPKSRNTPDKRVLVALSYLRVLRGRVSQRVISEATGIAQKTLSALESGNTKGIDFNTLVKLCDYFKCTPNDLLVIEEEPDDNTVPAGALEEADELIAVALTNAMNAPTQKPRQIWARFDSLWARMAASAGQSNISPKT